MSNVQDVSKSAAEDSRFVYSTRCSFMTSIHLIGTRPGSKWRLPCCPHCEATLLQIESKLKWYQLAEEFAAKKGDPKYVKFMEWCENRSTIKCTPVHSQRDFDDLRAEFDALNP